MNQPPERLNVTNHTCVVCKKEKDTYYMSTGGPWQVDGDWYYVCQECRDLTVIQMIRLHK